MARPATPLIIKGNFTPASVPRSLRVTTRLAIILLAVLLLGSLLLYGINVRYTADINAYGKKARETGENNKELQVTLNRVKAYKNVEKTAGRFSGLSAPSAVVEITATPEARLPKPPTREKEAIPVYGY